MKIKSLLMILGLVSILSGCVGVVERPAVVYVEPRPAIIVEPAYEVVIVNGVSVRHPIIVAPRPVIIHRHH